MPTVFPRWRDYVWHADPRDWERARVIAAGVDVGSRASKAAVMADGALIAYSVLWNEAGSRDNAWRALDAALEGLDMSREDIHYIVSTGSGQAALGEVKRSVSEISCHAKGANHVLGPSIRTVLALGGRGCSVIRINEQGKVVAFLTNASEPAYCRDSACNACGAAQGRGMEVVADYLGVLLDDVGVLSLKITDRRLKERLALPLDQRARVHDWILEQINEEPVTGGHLLDGGSPPIGGALSVVCDVLAKSQTSALLRNGWSKEEILAIYSAALAHQAAMLVKRLGVEGELAVVGGVAKNIGVVRRLEKELRLRVAVMKPDPQLSAALGAALYAKDFFKKA